MDAFLSLALTSFLLLLLPALLLLALLLPLAFPPEALDEELERDPDFEEDRDPDFDLDLDLELDLLDPGEELRDLDLEELRDFDLDLSESESELDNLDCLLKIPILDRLLKFKYLKLGSPNGQLGIFHNYLADMSVVCATAAFDGCLLPAWNLRQRQPVVQAEEKC